VVFFYRMLKTILLGIRTRKTSNALDPFEVTYRVWLNDLDFNLHVNNAKYMKFIDVVRLGYFVRAKPFSTAILKGLTPVLMESYVRYRKELKWRDRFTVRQEVVHADDRWVYFEVKFIRNGHVVFHALQKGGLYEKGVGMKRPDSFLPELSKFNDFPPSSYIQKFIDLSVEFQSEVKK
jgi:YbgC/YbaW family acyl-CoA thioester hydrolase